MLTSGSVFSGIGLLDYGLTLAGLEHRWFAEVDPFRRQILERRWPGVPVFDDIRAVGADAERVDVIAGGFPCKGGSTAGKRNGFDHPETALWREMRRVIGELRPRFVVVENVANLLAVSDGAVWAEVLADLAALGFDVVWDCVPAAAFGAPHLRDRVIAIATQSEGPRRPGSEPAVQQPRLGGVSRAGADAPTDTVGDGVRRQQSEPKRRGDGARVAAPACEAVADTDGGERRERGTGSSGERSRASWPHPDGRGVRVDWGDYDPAIRRWEAVHGSAPEPLVRRVDDRSAMRLERSRLSALGDGVQVQLGELVGRHLMRLATAPTRTTKEER